MTDFRLPSLISEFTEVHFSQNILSLIVSFAIQIASLLGSEKNCRSSANGLIDSLRLYTLRTLAKIYASG